MLENSFCNEYQDSNYMSIPKKKYDKELIMSLMDFIEDSLKKKLREIDTLVKKNNTDLKKVKKDAKSVTSIITAYHQAHNTKLLSDDIKFFFALVKENKSAKAYSITPKKKVIPAPEISSKNTSPFRKKSPAITYKNGKNDYSNVSSRLHHNTKSVDSKRNEKYFSRSNSVSCISNYTPKKSQPNIQKDLSLKSNRNGRFYDENNIESSESECKVLKKKVPTKNSERYINSTYTVSNRSKWFEENVLTQNEKKSQNNTPIKKMNYKKNIYGYEIPTISPNSLTKSNSKKKYYEDQNLTKKTNNPIIINDNNYKIIGDTLSPRNFNKDKNQVQHNHSQQASDKENANPNYINQSLISKKSITEKESFQMKNSLLNKEFVNPIMKNEKVKFVDSSEEKFFARMVGNFQNPYMGSHGSDELERDRINILPSKLSPKKKAINYDSDNHCKKQGSNEKLLKSLNSHANNSIKVKSNLDYNTNESSKHQIEFPKKYSSNFSHDTDQINENDEISKKFFDSENDTVEENKLVSDEERTSFDNDEKLWREMELERQNIVKMIESEFFTSQDTKETINKEKQASSRFSKDSINKNGHLFSINDSFNKQFSGNTDNLYEDKLNMDNDIEEPTVNMRKKSTSIENQEFEKIFNMQESPIANDMAFKMENYNEQSFNYEKEMNSDEKFSGEKNLITPLISFNYNYENSCNMKKSVSENQNPFSKDIKSDLLKKFKKTEFAQEIDYNKFKKSLDIILQMK